ncbi:short-chain dehydrogenase [Colletotrichum tofieldiae]|uniref:Short-chain dehydrogenase n=1 Tax=Colletotrichum tofieldiae TaxID=708197 RepID=A0A166V2H8_9PEZI|nr:short-chain dehydrogenase [Colletotrichum tofieldiae]GKT66215.1 short-chain dehydrogenase [Colletotrichum tofieldiae]GKT70617.1 short-chain dehydrogenase [Colletotrichum tofieldiae]GKT94510.1 short-chain dehydrogenase [Colletotrichum tofieldiae]
MSLASLRNMRSQWFPPKPAFTDQQIPSQKGRVFIVTGGNAGVGYELVKILYTTGATIYMASRSKERAEKAVETIKAIPAPKNPGSIKILPLDLNDLESVKAAAASFAQQETKLDVLWNNAGTGALGVEVGARTKQGFEAMIGMHCVAAQLFTSLLLSQLRAAVSTTALKGSVRVVWTSSFLGDASSPTNGIEFDVLDKGTPDRTRNYAVSKVGNWVLGKEMAARYGAEGIVSVTQNPGNLKAGSYAGTPALAMLFINPVLHEPKFGGYTELYAGLSPDISLENNGAYVIPWGRIRPDEDCPRKDILKALKPEAEGGLGYATKFWDWCEEQWKPHV